MKDLATKPPSRSLLGAAAAAARTTQTTVRSRLARSQTIELGRDLRQLLFGRLEFLHSLLVLLLPLIPLGLDSGDLTLVVLGFDVRQAESALLDPTKPNIAQGFDTYFSFVSRRFLSASSASSSSSCSLRCRASSSVL